MGIFQGVVFYFINLSLSWGKGESRLSEEVENRITKGEGE
jgi:hypothetical protein